MIVPRNVKNMSKLLLRTSIVMINSNWIMLQYQLLGINKKKISRIYLMRRLILMIWALKMILKFLRQKLKIQLLICLLMTNELYFDAE